MPVSPARVLRRVFTVVDARDGGACLRCGRLVGEVFSRQHRIPRGAGGSTKVNRPSNIVTLCGSATSPEGCHLWAESHRTDAEILGYLLPKLNPDIDPEKEPIFIHSDGWVLLDDLGGVTPCGEPRREPAE